uniref:F-box domain-containing protein n=1 Tax=Bionectria ochroleuca TaxID=29856 RepID=A0A8H7NB28_BIOOC
MELKDMPLEMIDTIIRHLFEYDDQWDATGGENCIYVSDARLVCRQWNFLASRHLFHSLHLRHEPQWLERWNELMDKEVVQQCTKRVHIDTSPMPFKTRNRHWVIWQNQGVYPSYTDALDRIIKLKNLTAVAFHYTKTCRTHEDLYYEEDVETESTRVRNLLNFFNVLHRRMLETPDASPIRSLTIENLQNLILPDLVSSDAFRMIIRELHSLHLVVGEERNTLDSEMMLDLRRPERLGFEPHLQTHWIEPIADQLTSLTIMFQVCWGAMPARFDTSRLHFPNLRVLHLGAYAIVHPNQFDWVLRSRGIHTLRLDRCFIGSHIRFNYNLRQQWGIETTGWVQLPRGAFGFGDEDDEVFTFNGTWEDVFNSIREELPALTDFRFDYIPEVEEVRETFLRRPDLMKNDKPYAARYSAFDTGWCEGWIANDGPMYFGDNNPSPSAPEPRPRYYDVVYELNREEETYEGDLWGLQALVAETRRRPYLQN